MKLSKDENLNNLFAAIAQKAANNNPFKKGTNNYARVYQAAWMGAEYALGERQL